MIIIQYFHSPENCSLKQKAYSFKGNKDINLLTMTSEVKHVVTDINTGLHYLFKTQVRCFVWRLQKVEQTAYGIQVNCLASINVADGNCNGIK